MEVDSAGTTVPRGLARGREGLLDIGIALAMSVVATSAIRFDGESGLSATILLVTLPLAARRLWPLPVLVLVTAGVLLTSARGGWVDIAAVALAAFTVGEHARDRLTSAASVLTVATLAALALLLQDRDALPDVALPYVILVPSWVVGDLVRSRRLEAEARAEEAARAERERVAGLEAALAEERRRIARELHDVVAHGVSVMLIQAGAARQVVHSEPERAEEALLAVEASGREAMVELRRLLNVLGDDADAGGLAPQPGVEQLEDLVERVRQAGLPADLAVEGERPALPTGVDIAIYRIAQEALTNALRYAQRARTLVHVAYDPSEVRLEILDDGPGSAPPRGGNVPDGSSGHGIAGMRERASLVGGRLEAGPRLGGGYAVRAWLPIPTDGA